MVWTASSVPCQHGLICKENFTSCLILSAIFFI
jgi:hypothetical protein